MAFPFTHHATINADGQTTYTKFAPYVASNNLVLISNTLNEVAYTVKIFDFVIVPNNSGGFPGGNGATAANVMY